MKWNKEIKESSEKYLLKQNKILLARYISILKTIKLSIDIVLD